MIERNQSDRRLITTERLAQFSQVEGGPDPGWRRMRLRPIRPSNQARHPDWVLIATLTFMVFCWIAFVFSICVIWVKCGGSSPF